MAMLSQQDHEFFGENGYILVKGAVSAKECEAAADAIWEFLEMDKDDPETWYVLNDVHRNGGWTDLFHHPALWATRSSPRLHQAFSEIWKTENLWVSMDKTNLKPPEHPDHPEFGHKGFLHWDARFENWPPDFGVQGVLYLTATSVEQGGFHCIPGMDHTPKSLEAVATQGGNNNTIDIDKYLPIPVPGECGDFVIWRRQVPHGNGRNTADQPRIAQYITMSRAVDDDEQRQQKVAQYQKGMVDTGWEADTGGKMRGPSGTFELTPLGRRLSGLDRWDF